MASSLYKANLTYQLPSAAATTNSTSVGAAPVQLFSVYAYNAAASVRYLKFYNKATAPTVGTDTPVLVFGIPAGGTLNVTWAKGLYLSTGLGFGIVTGAADNNTTAPSAGDLTGVTIGYSL